MAERVLIVDADSIAKLLVHYTNESERRDMNDLDKIPLDVQVTGIGFSRFLPAWIGFEMASDSWPDAPDPAIGGYRPIHIRYEGGRVARWSQQGDAPMQWTFDYEKPRRQ